MVLRFNLLFKTSYLDGLPGAHFSMSKFLQKNPDSNSVISVLDYKMKETIAIVPSAPT